MVSLVNIENRRYIGSKSKLKSWIFTLIEEHCMGKSFLDIFSGTGIIAAEASTIFESVIINDILYSNQVIYEAFF